MTFSRSMSYPGVICVLVVFAGIVGAPVVDDSVPDEVIAVISVAVYSMYGSREKVRIKSVKRSKKRSAWANAGVIENTRPF